MIFMCTHECLVHVLTCCQQLNIVIHVEDLCDNIGLVLVCLPSGSTDVAASPSQYVPQPSGIPILSPVLFMHVGDPYIPPF